MNDQQKTENLEVNASNESSKEEIVVSKFLSESHGIDLGYDYLSYDHHKAFWPLQSCGVTHMWIGKGHIDIGIYRTANSWDMSDGEGQSQSLLPSGHEVAH